MLLVNYMHHVKYSSTPHHETLFQNLANTIIACGLGTELCEDRRKVSGHPVYVIERFIEES